MPNGNIIDEFHCIEFKMQAAAIILLDDQKRIMLIRSYRYTTESCDWEIPAGCLDPGETVIEAAQREALEETGYATKDPKHIYTYCPINGVSNHKFNLIQCTATQKIQEPDPDEVQEARWFTYAQVSDLIDQNKIKDGLALTGLLFYLLKKS
ncbi:MAG: 8-oxo-dGTP pyrophosphatase MutT (NUDIX family) [Candidatus Omnitrophota bacterium]|jgi:8-oxo-dGTP pyrophosphatase MutT (NUDIX family)